MRYLDTVEQALIIKELEKKNGNYWPIHAGMEDLQAMRSMEQRAAREEWMRRRQEEQREKFKKDLHPDLHFLADAPKSIRWLCVHLESQKIMERLKCEAQLKQE